MQDTRTSTLSHVTIMTQNSSLQRSNAALLDELNLCRALLKSSNEDRRMLKLRIESMSQDNYSVRRLLANTTSKLDASQIVSCVLTVWAVAATVVMVFK